MPILISFILALMIAIIFSAGYRRNRKPVELVVFFFILFFAGITANFWIVPFGPSFHGISWIPVLIIILMVALLLAVPPPTHKKIDRKDDEIPEEAIAISVFVWILLLLFILAAGFGYYHGYYQRPL